MELKPCPFCGGEAKLEVKNLYGEFNVVACCASDSCVGRFANAQAWVKDEKGVEEAKAKVIKEWNDYPKRKEKKHYSWWGYIREIVQKYPERKGLELYGADKHAQEAVQAAIDATERMVDGEARLKVIRLVLWDGTYQLQGAALQIPCGKSTAARWQKTFFEMVARNRGIID